MKTRINGVVTIVLLTFLMFALASIRNVEASDSEPAILMYVSPSQTTEGTNTTFNIDVKLDSVANHSGVMGVRFELSWDPALLDGVNITEVMFHEVTPESEWENILTFHTDINTTGGYARYEITFYDYQRALNGGYAPIFGNHTLATIAFTVKGSGRCSLHLDTDCVAVDENAVPIPLNTIDGFFKNLVLGDVNGDGVVDLLDAIMVAKAFGASAGDANWNPDADVNGDGRINIMDMILLGTNFGRTG